MPDGNITFYDRFARFYEAANPRRPEEFECHRRLAQGAARVLELCCGTGTLMPAFLAVTPDCTGLDAAAAMLDRARERHPTVVFHQADMRRFDLGQQFDHVVCAFNSFLHLLDDDDAVAALRCMAAHCAPGGRVVIDIFNVLPEFMPPNIRGAELNRFDDPMTGAPLLAIEDSDFDAGTRISQVRWRVEERQSGRVLASESYRMRAYQADEITDLCNRAGLTITARYGDHALTPFHRLSPHQITVARRADAKENRT